MPAGLVSDKGPLLGLQMDTVLTLLTHCVLAFLSANMSFSLCMCIPGISSSSYRDTDSIGLGPHPYDLI